MSHWNKTSRQGDSQYWTGLIKFKNLFFLLMKIHCGESEKCLISEAWWLGDKPPQHNLPRLYNIHSDKNLFVVDVLGKGLDHIHFRRT